MRALLVAALLMIAGPAWPDAAKPIIAMYGDSTTLGTTGSNAIGYSTTPKNEPAMLQAAIWPHAIVENRGITGFACYDLMNGKNGSNDWWQEMAASKAAIVTINVGQNDSHQIPDTTFADCLASLIQIAQNAGKIVAVESPNPSTISYGFGTVESYAAAAMGAAISNDAYAIDQFTYISQYVPDWSAHLPDGIHPDAWLYGYKATVALMVLRPTVKRLP
jgi:hypothetical protein